MKNGFRLGRIAGIQVSADWSWLFIAVLLTWNLTAVFATWHPDWGVGVRATVAVCASALFFASVLTHEFAHSLVARAQGIPVKSITLWLFGGVSNLEREPTSPRAEFFTAIVGPLTSLALGFVFLSLGALGVVHVGHLVHTPRAVFGTLGPVATLLVWLGPINVALGLFNLVPAFPLDGGRVLRSGLWAAMGDLRRATRWTSAISQTIAWGFILTGIAMAFGARVPYFGTGIANGLWLSFIGWFLNSAAVRTWQQAVIEDLLGDLTVGRLMRRTGPVVVPELNVERFVNEWILGSDDRAYPVMVGAELRGMMCLSDVRKVPRSAWEGTTVAQLMTPAGELVVVGPEEGVSEALNKLARRDVAQLPVMHGGRLVGMLLLRDITRWIELQSTEGPPHHPATA